MLHFYHKDSWAIDEEIFGFSQTLSQEEYVLTKYYLAILSVLLAIMVINGFI